MLKIKQTIIVEGKYDKIKLESVVDAVIIPTNGYGIFQNKEQMDLIRLYAEKTGIIILTDSDVAGFKIRSYIKGFVPAEFQSSIINVYIPAIFGKESRKSGYSAEKTLGVEGVSKEIILDSLRKAGVYYGCEQNSEKETTGITRMDFFELGLTGTPDSAKLRAKVLEKLGLPRLSTVAMLHAVNLLINRDELEQMVK